MIFTTLDFHVNSKYGEEPLPLARPFRLRTNYIVDSFNLRVPKKVKTRLFHKLNVSASYMHHQTTPLFAFEGYGSVEFVDPKVASIYKTSRVECIKRVKRYLKRGLRVAAKADPSFGKHLAVWEHLLATVDEEFDHEFRISRSHRSRRWRADVVLRITPTAYHYDVLVKDSKTLETLQRHRIKTTKPLFPFFSGLGFSKLRWHGGDIVGLAKDGRKVFRFHTGLPA